MRKVSAFGTGSCCLSTLICMLILGQNAWADFVYNEPVKVPNVNSVFHDAGVGISADGLELYFHSLRSHGPIGGKGDIWVSRRSTPNEPWSDPVMLDPPVNSNGPEFDPCLSADGLELYLSDGWPDYYGFQPKPGGYGGGDLWVSRRASKDDLWGEVENLGPVVNTVSAEDNPSISADGLSLYFRSNRSGGYGASDLYVTTRQSKAAPWEPAVNLGQAINSSNWESTPFISPDGLSLFYANGEAFTDIWVNQRASIGEPWGEPKNFAPVNQTGAAYSLLFAPGGTTLYFSRGIATFPIDSFDIWQVEVTTIMDLNGDGAVDTLDIDELQGHLGNTDDSLYDIAPFPLGDGVADDKDLFVLKDYLSLIATDPYPASQADNILPDLVLSWEPIASAQTYDVYLGTDYGEIRDATTSDASYMGQLETNSFDPGGLDFGQTYYWRIDEANEVSDSFVFRGEVWSFTTEPFSYPVENVTATASSSNAENMGPEKTVDGSGLDALGQHSTLATDMWLSSPGAAPWIQYDFDRVYKLDQLLVWNSNQVIEAFLGFGAKDVIIESSVDGTEWTVLEGATLFNQATGAQTYTANTSIDFAGAMAQSVRITVNSGYGMIPQYGLSEVRFLYIPTTARKPEPSDASAVNSTNVLLSWRAGWEAASHQVFLGTDASDLALAATTSAASYALSALNYATTYYWSVTEVNEGAVIPAHAGDVWSFTTPDYGIVDDFDQYDDACNRIFFTWEDGLGHTGGESINDCDVPAFNGNGGGSIIGSDQPPFAERTIVNVGSTQSLRFSYDNSSGQSESTLTLTGQDWTTGGVQTLSLFFYGQIGNSGQLYVKINDTKLVCDGDVADLTQTRWQQWDIDLTSLPGLKDVTTLTIGVDGANAAGMLYVDDLRLYP
jgi:hypothetical protein